jgi:hypothetical protein
VQWTPVQQITLHPETANEAIWSAPISVTVTCIDTGEVPPQVLQGATFAISAYSSGLTDLVVTVDGNDPTKTGVTLPVATVDPITGNIAGPPAAQLATGLSSNRDGIISFAMRANSFSHPNLSPTGEATEIGLDVQFLYQIPSDTSPTGWLPIRMKTEGELFAATPELDSLALFGTGAAGLAAYALMRTRAHGRRRD